MGLLSSNPYSHCLKTCLVSVVTLKSKSPDYPNQQYYLLLAPTGATTEQFHMITAMVFKFLFVSGTTGFLLPSHEL